MPPKRKATKSTPKVESESSGSTKRRKSEPETVPEQVNEEQSEVEAKPSTDAPQVPADDTSVKQSPSGRNFNLKIVSWNVNGIRAALKNNAFDYFRADSCDILCLQETKCTNKDFPDQLKEWREFPHKYYAASNKAGYAGVAMFAKRKPLSVKYGLGMKEHDEEGRVITAFFEDFVLVNTYTPNSGRGLVRLDYRQKWDEDFRNYLRDLDSQKPVILCGDLNVSHKEIDLENPKSNVKNAGFTPEERADFTQLLEAGFIDSYRALYPDRKRAYTYWSYMRAARSKNVGWRLDYFVLSTRLRESLCDNQIRNKVMGSDHCPIVLYLGM